MNKSQSPDPGTGVYIHVPFCTKRCHYCDFNTVSGQENLINRYVESLVREMERRLSPLAEAGRRVRSVFFGGGTPSLLAPDQIGRLIRCVGNHLPGADGAEITLEGNPEGLHPETLAGFRQAGVNRLSIGVQSFSDATLKSLGRIHNSIRALEAVRTASDLGFENISVDLMFGLPGQSPEDWEKDLDTVLTLPVRHISAYNLIVEEGTPFSRWERENRLRLPSEEGQVRMYETAIDRLAGAGFQWYEISNFAKPGFACEHNLIYWHNREYVGIGAGAVSYLGGARYQNVRETVAYLDSVASAEGPATFVERLEEEETIGETVMLNLRLIGGFDLLEFQSRFGISFRDRYPSEIDRLMRLGLIHVNGTQIRLTRHGVLLSNEVFREFLSVSKDR